MEKINYEFLSAYSDVILEMNTITDVKAMTLRFLENIKFMVSFDGARIYLYNNKEQQYSLVLSHRAIAKETTTLKEMGIPNLLSDGNGSFVFKDSDFTEEPCGKEISPSFYGNNRFSYSLHIILKHEEDNIGVVNLYRNVGNFDYTYENVVVCNIFKDHLAFRYNHELEALFSLKFTLSEVVTKYGLTQREAQVLKGLLDVKDNYEISDEMSISVFIIKKHIMNIYKKL